MLLVEMLQVEESGEMLLDSELAYASAMELVIEL